MKKLYEKSELWFALAWIAAYCVLESLANPLSEQIGMAYAAHAAVTAALSAVLFFWLKGNGLFGRYGLCKPAAPARAFLWYIPLVLLASHNLWNGTAINFPAAVTVCYVIHMACVGFVEEVLFRGFLFKAMERDGVRSAAAVSSVTFGLGHLLNLVNGSDMELVENLCQVAAAIVIGFLFVTIFYRGGSLLPCILTHSAIDVTSAFASSGGLTDGRRMLLSASRLAITAAYALILTKTLPAGAAGCGGQKGDVNMNQNVVDKERKPW